MGALGWVEVDRGPMVGGRDRGPMGGGRDRGPMGGGR